MSAHTTSEATPRASAQLSTAASDDLLREVVQYAILAPSGHNTQPWRFRVYDGALELLADRTRALPIVDPHDRALIISCGAALAFLRVALHHLGREPTLDLVPDRGNGDLLARVRIGEPRVPSESDEALFRAIPHRRTNRQPFGGRHVPKRLLRELAECAASEGAWLRVVTEPALKGAVADLVAEGDRRQAADPAFRRELSSWMHPSWTRARDGMPGYAHGFSNAGSLVMPLVVRTFDWGTRQAAKDRALAATSPALLLLGTGTDSVLDWLRAGQALGRLLLRATVDGVAASFLNQPIEVASLRTRLAETLEVHDFPQLLLRVGYGPETRPTPRRSVTETLVERSARAERR
jgi:nitroreductase